MTTTAHGTHAAHPAPKGKTITGDAPSLREDVLPPPGEETIPPEVTIAAYKQAAQDAKAILETDIVKLQDFMNIQLENPLFTHMDVSNKTLMQQQLGIMIEYDKILERIIATF